jgi:nucleoside-diphosphate-sugar epimerase
MEKILVTGANGFIGSNLVKRLSDDGNLVKGFVRKTSDLSFLEGLNVEVALGDITDINTLEIATKGIDKVYHVAGLAADWGPYSLFDRINFEGTRNVALAANRNGVKKLIHISTVAFHGFGKINMNENSPVPKNLIPYAKTKFLAEEWLWQFAKTSDVKITAIRPGNVFGINDRTFITKYIDALLKGKFAQVNNGKSLTCPIFIDNLTDIITMVGNSEKADNNAFIATDGLKINWQTFNYKLAKSLGIKLPKTSIPYKIAYPAAKAFYGMHRFFKVKTEPFLTPYRVNNGGQDYHFSIEKLKQFFDYAPKTDIDTAIQKTVDKNQSG